MRGQGIVVGGESFDGEVLLLLAEAQPEERSPYLVQSFAVCIMPSVNLLEIIVDFVEAMLQRIL
jgi:hypothetical protein